MCDISTKLETILSEDNEQYKPILLLSKLVDDRFISIKEEQRKHSDTSEKTQKMILELSKKVEEALQETKSCPVNKQKESFETISFFITKPKLAVATVLGITVLSIMQLWGLLSTFLQFIIDHFTSK